PRLHEGGAARDGVGLPVAGPHAHAGFAREPAAPEAPRPLGLRLARQRVGCRLPTVQAGVIRVPLRRRQAGVDDQLHASVEELATLLAREERARAEFIGKVSHELRTPLTV